jgi:pimeloyl-ACP methyl ester carboxylesterase
MTEKAVLFGQDKSLVGILSEPLQKTNKGLPALILLNAGMLHRVGPNRLNVNVARKMAAAGFTVLRFDFSGLGDSRVRNDNLPFEKSSIAEIEEAMNFIQSTRDIDRFILAGLCSGADVTFKMAGLSDRVAGAVMINCYNISNLSLKELSTSLKAQVQERYYKSKMFNLQSWRRFLTGKSKTGNIRSLLSSKAGAILGKSKSEPVRLSLAENWRKMVEQGVDMLLIYSEGSSALDVYRMVPENEFMNIKQAGKLNIEIVKNTDHVFTLQWSQKHLVDLIYRWVQDGNRTWSPG